MISKMASIHLGIQDVAGMFLNCNLKGDGLRAMLMEICTLANNRRHFDILRFLLGNGRVNYGLLR